MTITYDNNLSTHAATPPMLLNVTPITGPSFVNRRKAKRAILRQRKRKLLIPRALITVSQLQIAGTTLRRNICPPLLQYRCVLCYQAHYWTGLRQLTAPIYFRIDHADSCWRTSPRHFSKEVTSNAHLVEFLVPLLWFIRVLWNSSNALQPTRM